MILFPFHDDYERILHTVKVHIHDIIFSVFVSFPCIRNKAVSILLYTDLINNMNLYFFYCHYVKKNTKFEAKNNKIRIRKTRWGKSKETNLNYPLC